MTRSELLELIANGQNSGVEFKRDAIRPYQLAKEIVAFLNFQGGCVLIGVEDDGTISGVQRQDLETWVMDTVIRRFIHPTIEPFYEEVQIDEREKVAIVTVSQGTTKPYVIRNKNREEIYVRIGSTSRLATREQQARLYALGGLLFAEKLPVSGSTFNDLDENRLKDYLTAIVGDLSVPTDEEEWLIRLCGLGYMTEIEGGAIACTIAGLLMFGHAPRRFLAQAGIRWLAFDGDDKEYRALDDRVIDGPMAGLRNGYSRKGNSPTENGLIDNLIDAMRPFITTESDEVDDSLRRERKWIYPVDALRETIVNALGHRDWTQYEQIEIVRYAGRLEVTSPGALQNSMTVEKMIAGQRSPRNSLIVEVLRDYGYADARGMGIRKKVIPLLKEHNGTEPHFQATEDYLKVTLYES